ncbi:MAG: non-heme iron oxygenase ferredoxin subunit [Acidobacteria bacterium]|nr:non-heme iron oxygenase ferredoxin subunit [Acidobacteriota bacterium]
MPESFRVAAKADINPGTAKCVEAGGRRLAVFNVGGDFYAIDDSCTHRGGPLSEGQVQGTTVVCPWHGASFDIATGSKLTPPAMAAVRSYRVEVNGEDIMVEIS